MSERTIGNATVGNTANLTAAAKFIMTNSSGATRTYTHAEVQDSIHSGSVTLTPSGTGAAGAAGEVDRLTKKSTAIANNVSTAILLVTVPNAAHNASIVLHFTGALGAGGAVGASEASAGISYRVTISRTAGLDTVVGISSAYGSSGSVAVAGAATCTVTGSVSAVSGASSGAQTFTINVTIARGSGASTNHTCITVAELQNMNASGVTIL